MHGGSKNLTHFGITDQQQLRAAVRLPWLALGFQKGICNAMSLVIELGPGMKPISAIDLQTNQDRQSLNRQPPPVLSCFRDFKLLQEYINFLQVFRKELASKTELSRSIWDLAEVDIFYRSSTDKSGLSAIEQTTSFSPIPFLRL